MKCAVDDCNRLQLARGWCATHYMRWHRTGSIADPVKMSLAERLQSKIGKPHGEEGCWTFNGSQRGGGYVQVKVNGRPHPAHRAVYETFIGPVAAELQLDHLCRNRWCVNPAHLEPVTPKENARRGLHGVLLTHCPQGHSYDAANTGIVSGKRVCRACRAERQDKYNANRRARRAEKRAAV